MTTTMAPSSSSSHDHPSQWLFERYASSYPRLSLTDFLDLLADGDAFDGDVTPIDAVSIFSRSSSSSTNPNHLTCVEFEIALQTLCKSHVSSLVTPRVLWERSLYPSTRRWLSASADVAVLLRRHRLPLRAMFDRYRSPSDRLSIQRLRRLCDDFHVVSSPSEIRAACVDRNALGFADFLEFLVRLSSRTSLRELMDTMDPEGELFVDRVADDDPPRPSQTRLRSVSTPSSFISASAFLAICWSASLLSNRFGLFDAREIHDTSNSFAHAIGMVAQHCGTTVREIRDRIADAENVRDNPSKRLSPSVWIVMERHLPLARIVFAAHTIGTSILERSELFALSSIFESDATMSARAFVAFARRVRLCPTLVTPSECETIWHASASSTFCLPHFLLSLLLLTERVVVAVGPFRDAPFAERLNVLFALLDPSDEEERRPLPRHRSIVRRNSLLCPSWRWNALPSHQRDVASAVLSSMRRYERALFELFGRFSTEREGTRMFLSEDDVLRFKEEFDIAVVTSHVRVALFAAQRSYAVDEDALLCVHFDGFVEFCTRLALHMYLRGLRKDTWDVEGDDVVGAFVRHVNENALHLSDELIYM